MKPVFIFIITSIILLTLIIEALLQSSKPSNWEIHFIQQNGNIFTFIRSPSDKRILIDGGGNSGVINHISKFIPYFSRRIDSIILTRCDKAHVTGLIDVLRRYDVGTIVVADSFKSHTEMGKDGSCQEFEKTIMINGVEVRKLSKRMTLSIDEKSLIEVLFPESEDIFEYSNASPPYLAFRISIGSTSLLYLGDPSLKIQRDFVEDITKTDLLFIDNSANEKSLLHELVEASSPKYLIYVGSTKTNKKGSKVENYANIGSILKDNRFNLSINNKITAYSDGGKIWVKR